MDEAKANMDVIIPLTLYGLDAELKAPLSIFNKDGCTIQIEDFSSEEKNDFFQIMNFEIKDGEPYYGISPERHPFAISVGDLSTKYRDLLLGNYKLVVRSGGTKEFWTIIDRVEFIFKTVLGIGFLMRKTMNKNSSVGNGFSKLNRSVISRREIKVLSKSDFEKMKNLMSSIINGNLHKHIPKIDTLKFFLDTAMSQFPNPHIASAFYIVILESIFCKTSQELSYKFSMRLAKIRKEGMIERKKYQGWYDKRSKIFHGGRSNFDKEEITELEKIACWAIQEYIKKPEAFEENQLDEQLLDCNDRNP